MYKQCGVDFKEYLINQEKKEHTFLTSIKIYEITKLLDKALNLNRNIEEFLVKKFNVLISNDNKNLYVGNDYPSKFKSIEKISCLCTNDNLTMCAIALDQGNTILINCNENFIDRQINSIKIRFLQKIETELSFTNIAFTKLNYKKSDLIDVLYISTINFVYYYKFTEKKIELSMIKTACGAQKDGISIKEDKLLIASNTDPFIMELINFEKGPLWLFEGKKQVN